MTVIPALPGTEWIDAVTANMENADEAGCPRAREVQLRIRRGCRQHRGRAGIFASRLAPTPPLAALGRGRVPAVAAASRFRLPAEAARGARYEHRGGRARRDAAAGVRRRQGRLALSGRSGRGFVAVPAGATELRGPPVLGSEGRRGGE